MLVTVELPEYSRPSKCERKIYLSIVTNFPLKETTFHWLSISVLLKRPPLRDETALSKSDFEIVFFLGSLLKERKN
jgi:hypothetical protein